MSIKASVYIATSLDGFIARKDGNLDWLLGDSTSAEDYGYAEYMSTVDVLVMGRITYEKVLTFGEWPYTGKRVVVLSRSLSIKDIPKALTANVELHPGPATELVAALEASGAKHIYVDGGKVIQAFLVVGLIQMLTITRIPVLIGSGIPLFGETDRDIKLHHLTTTAFANGYVQSTYQVTG
jgi:dihydrofolate reductase